MRSYDWRMPEEKYRTTIDHLSDVIYAYVEEYKLQGIAEGIRPENIVVTGNPIVDVISEYFLSGRIRLGPNELSKLRNKFALRDGENFWVMTCHRRENVDSPGALSRILQLAEEVKAKVIFLAGYRTQRNLKQFGFAIPNNILVADPIGYAELLELIYSAEGVLTDSGTIVEETSVLGVPSVQMRTSTERPQVYDCGGSVKFDPHDDVDPVTVRKIIESVRLRTTANWEHGLGDGRASERIAHDLMQRLQSQTWSGHNPDLASTHVSRNYGWGIGSLGKP
jgi:UDP-N-acetylglucosamine 2-epimerase (non-hydrolysing)